MFCLMAVQMDKTDVIPCVLSSLATRNDTVFVPLLAVENPVTAVRADPLLGFGYPALQRTQGIDRLLDLPLLPVPLQVWIVLAGKPAHHRVPFDGGPGMLPHVRLVTLEGPFGVTIRQHPSPIALSTPACRLVGVLPPDPTPLELEQVVVQLLERSRRYSHAEVVGPSANLGIGRFAQGVSGSAAMTAE